MATIDRNELDRLERHAFQLTILSAAFVLILAAGVASFMYPLVFVHPEGNSWAQRVAFFGFCALMLLFVGYLLNRQRTGGKARQYLLLVILAAGLAIFMYPLVFVHPEGNKWTLRVAFFGFCVLTLLFVGYLFDRQRTFGKLKRHLLAELERNAELQIQASADLLHSMPDQNHFWDRLTMEYRRAMTMQKNLSLVLIKVKPAARASLNDQKAALSDAVKVMSKRLRPSDSIYHLADDVFGVVLPETETINAKRVALRLQEGLQDVRAKHGSSFDLSAHNYPDHVKSSHELEDIVKSMLPENQVWEIPSEAPAS